MLPAWLPESERQPASFRPRGRHAVFLAGRHPLADAGYRAGGRLQSSGARRRKACPHGGQFQHLVADRRAKGFTVYQTYPSATNPAWWTTPYTAINPQRFRDVFDVQMNHLAEQGFVIALGFGHFNNSTNIPVDDLRRWARYLVARYGAHPVVWITCQEMNAPEDGGRNRIDVWRAVAEEIQRADGYGHPHSAHQWVLDARTRPLGNESWHDWFALQGGHRGSRLTPQARYAEYFAFQPARPVLETEAMYELVDCGGVRHRRCAALGVEGPVVRLRRLHLRGRRRVGAEMGSGRHAMDQLQSPDRRLVRRNGSARIAADDVAEAVLSRPPLAFAHAAFFRSRLGPVHRPRGIGPGHLRARSVRSLFLRPVPIAGHAAKPRSRRLLPADWFDPRIGAWTPIDMNLRADNGQWTIPPKPDGDWVLVVRPDRSSECGEGSSGERASARKPPADLNSHR